MKELRSQSAHYSSPVLNDAGELRQLLIKKNEKIEFLKDHIDQLLEELHRKSRCVTCTVLVAFIYFPFLPRGEAASAWFMIALMLRLFVLKTNYKPWCWEVLY